MKSKFAILGLVLTAMVAAVGCSKDPLTGLTEEDSRIYITNYDSTARFSSYQTFSVADSVAVINNGQASRQLNSTDQAYINAVKQQLQAKGYVLVNKNGNPDLSVNISRIYNSSTGLIRYADYYDYYGSFYDPFYYGFSGYPYYSPFRYATYSIREGALSMDVLDLKNAPTSNRINVVFTGLIRGSGIFNSNTAAQQVKMLFDQSPYFKSN